MNVNELIGSAVKAVTDGYNEGIGMNRGRAIRAGGDEIRNAPKLLAKVLGSFCGRTVVEKAAEDKLDKME